MSDDDRTRIQPRGRLRPKPGGVAAPAAKASGEAAPAAPREPVERWRLPRATRFATTPARRSGVGRSPLVGAAMPLLGIAPSLRTADPGIGPDALRLRFLDALESFEREAAATGVTPAVAQSAAWALSALLDDIVLSTPWGRSSSWPHDNLVVRRYNEVDAGERFFDRLAELERDPQRHADLLELYYLCLTLGFEGRYRGAVDATDAWRRDLARLVADPTAKSASLSPNWAGETVPDEPRRFRVPLWVLAIGTAAVLLVAYTGFAYRVGAQVEQLVPLALDLPPHDTVTLTRPPPPMRADAPAEDDATAPADREATPVALPYEIWPAIAEAVPAAVAERVVESDETPAALRLNLRSPDLFASGQAAINARHRPTVDAIAHVLAEEPGRLIVTGHSDNIPIRSPRFPSNWELSEARAASVRDVLVAAGIAPDRVRVEARADTEPVASNATAAGRALNRRVEIHLAKPPLRPE